MPESRLIITNPHDWLHQLSELALSSSAASDGDEVRRLRAARALLARAPYPALLAGVSLPDPLVFEAMLDANATESAALSLLDSDCGIMISRSGDGDCLASVLLPGRSEEVTAAANTIALAVIAALSLALGDIPAPTSDFSDDVISPVMRLN